jgi:beta-lactamase class A
MRVVKQMSVIIPNMFRLFFLLLGTISICNAVVSPISDKDFARDLHVVRTEGLPLSPAVIIPGRESAVSPDISEIAEQVAGMISPDPQVTESLFDASFLEKVPAERLKSTFTQIYAQYGRVHSVILTSQDTANSGSFRFLYERRIEMQVDLNIAPGPPAKITGLIPHQGHTDHHSIAEVVKEIKQLPGKAGFMLAEISPGFRVLHQLNPDKPLALGSTFKLYVLAALQQVGLPWDKVLTIREDWKSLPSGILHTWPAGTPITIYDLAEKMISISDNTATDHLLYSIGRERVEGMLGMLGNSHPELSTPFISTLELFKIKSFSEMLKRYAAGDTAGRRALLQKEILAISRDQIRMWSLPVAIDSVEWFASPMDICRLMEYFHKQNNLTILKILAKNPGLEIPGTFSYAGYKGGAEPGVLNMSWLLKTHDGRVYALSAGWNNSAGVLDSVRFMALLQTSINLLGGDAASPSLPRPSFSEQKDAGAFF